MTGMESDPTTNGPLTDPAVVDEVELVPSDESASIDVVVEAAIQAEAEAKAEVTAAVEAADEGVDAAAAEGQTEGVVEADAEAASPADELPTAETAGGGPKWWALAAWVLAAIVIATLALAGYAHAVDRRESQLLPNGVTIAGVAVGGLTPVDARTLVEETVATRTSFNVGVAIDDAIWSIPASECVDVNVDGALAEASAIRGSATLAERLSHDLLGEPISQDVTFEYIVVSDPIRALVEGVASLVETSAVDASLGLVGGVPTWSAGREGVAVDREATIGAVEAMLRESINSTTTATVATPADVRVDIVRTTTAQSVTLDSLAKRAILVDLSSRKLTLYEQGKTLRTWSVATGAPGFPTPKGTFRIVLKRYMPTWGNPGSDWAVNMPPSIPPGPNNPLGVRALNLNVSGIRIHGTANIASLGTAASHGCVRMANADIITLYDMVEVGTPVYIVK